MSRTIAVLHKEPMMDLEASDHGCPHLREQRLGAGTPSSNSRAQPSTSGAGAPSAVPSRQDGFSVASSNAGGWWAFASQARAIGASA